MNPTFLRLELTRLRRDPVLLLIVIALPVVFFVGASLALPGTDLGAGVRDSLRESVMVGLACYGAATAASTLTGQAALERVHGWSRQLALTPLTPTGYLLVKGLVALVAVVTSVAIMFIVAAILGVAATPVAWVLTALAVALPSVTWALYGLVVGLSFRSESALAASAAGLVLMAMAGGALVPLPDTLTTFAQFTPLYGHVELARFALTVGTDSFPGWSAALVPALNWIAWTALLALLALRHLGRSRERG